MSLSVTLADANILISRTLRDYFVYAAKLGALDIHWSDGILDEASRNLIGTFDFSREDADVLVDRLSVYIPTALVEVNKRDKTRVTKVEMDAKDRHVLAAALSAKAELPLTQNTRLALSGCRAHARASFLSLYVLRSTVLWWNRLYSRIQKRRITL